MNPVSFQYCYHAVGQGLFCSGQLDRTTIYGHEQFWWIVDCGTKSDRTLLDRETKLFTDTLSDQPIHLACISHFDEDHVNGASDLLAEHRVESLILPFFPLVERMLIALDTPDASDAFLQFLIDPAGYLYNVAPENLGTVYLISNPVEGGEDLSPITIFPSDKPNDEPSKAKHENQPDPEDVRGSSTPDFDVPVIVVDHATDFRVANFWEFMFYNEHKSKFDLQTLRDEIVYIIKNHRIQDGTFKKDDFLAALREAFDDCFGTTSPARNRISLITYTGPLLRDRQRALHPSAGVVVPVDGFSTGVPYLWQIAPTYGNKPSALYTGDFPLTSRLRMKAIKAHFRLRRWRKIGVLQVPHHGSLHSWFYNEAKHFTNNWSVFSAKSGSDDHPAPCVEEDFKDRGPIKVNEYQRFISNGRINL